MISLKTIFSKPFFTEKKYIISIWLLLSVIAGIKQYSKDSYNNYKIFANVFRHVVNKLSLYAEYPNEYFDHNHYGPVFSLLIAPFSMLPDWLGVVLWSVFNASVLIWAITKLPLKSNQINLILWICAHEFLTSSLSLQFNPIMTAIIVLSFVFIEEKKDIWATLLIVLGTYIKLYGIVGLAFFFFSKNKPKFVIWGIIWSVVLFILPMLISSPEYIIHSYVEWYERLQIKNNMNASLDSMQDISVMGMIRRVSENINFENFPVLLSGLILFTIPYLRIKEYKNLNFRLFLLSSVLIFTVIFSTGSESPTYIIAFVGVAIWFVIQNKPLSKTTLFLLIFAMLLTSFSPSDLFPKFIREEYIKPYALKALPCLLIWLMIIYQMIFANFTTIDTLENDTKSIDK